MLGVWFSSGIYLAEKTLCAQKNHNKGAVFTVFVPLLSHFILSLIPLTPNWQHLYRKRVLWRTCGQTVDAETEGRPLMMWTGVGGVCQELCSVSLVSRERCACVETNSSPDRLLAWSGCVAHEQNDFGGAAVVEVLRGEASWCRQPLTLRPGRGGVGRWGEAVVVPWAEQRRKRVSHWQRLCSYTSELVKNNTEYSINRNIWGFFGAPFSNRFITVWFILNVNSIKLGGKTKWL